ncbi:MAG TPA: Hsp20 family protein [Azospirillaceae bacterium]|nr:Hsp20 family protein [Azospirillaceae bacterium]
MRTFDLSPLFRSTVGFDRMTRILEAALNGEEAANGYPPYNIEKLSEDDYRITMAVAGFSEDELEIVQRENTLVVVGKQAKEAEHRQFLYRGIAGRQFERRFQLADHIKVVGANLVNGLLNIDLKREIPEAAKPRTIRIETAAPTAQALEQKVGKAA